MPALFYKRLASKLPFTIKCFKKAWIVSLLVAMKWERNEAMKKLLIVLTVILLASNGSAFALDATDKSMAKRFHQFNPNKNPVTEDIADCTFVAYGFDQKKTAAKLMAWPKDKLQTLAPLMEKRSPSMDSWENWSMAFLQASSLLVEQVTDLAGLQSYSEVITGKLGESLPADFDNGRFTPECYKFHLEGKTTTRKICFQYGTFTALGEEGSSCSVYDSHVRLRLHLFNKEDVGKVEFLDKCSAK